MPDMTYNISHRDDPPPPCPECAALRHDIARRVAIAAEQVRLELGALRHDIARHVAIAAEQAGEIEQLRKDALRYQWLRRNPVFMGWEHDFLPTEVDAAIDAALKEQK
jgi:hypothetical protein